MIEGSFKEEYIFENIELTDSVYYGIWGEDSTQIQQSYISAIYLKDKNKSKNRTLGLAIGLGVGIPALVITVAVATVSVY